MARKPVLAPRTVQSADLQAVAWAALIAALDRAIARAEADAAAAARSRTP